MQNLKIDSTISPSFEANYKAKHLVARLKDVVTGKHWSSKWLTKASFEHKKAYITNYFNNHYNSCIDICDDLPF